MMTFDQARIVDCTGLLNADAHRKGYSAHLHTPENILIIRDWSGVEWTRFVNVRNVAEAQRELDGASSEVWA